MKIRVVKRVNLACSPIIAMLMLFSGFGFGQAQDGVSPHSAWDGEVNITNQNLLINIPIFKRLGSTYNLTVNNYAQVVPGGGNFWTIHTDLIGKATGSGSTAFTGGLEVCDPGPPIVQSSHYTNWQFIDGLGTKHHFPIDTESNNCLGYGPTGSAIADDGSGYYMSVVNGNQASVWDVGGNVPTFAFGVTSPDGINDASYNGVWPITMVVTNGTGSPATYTWKDSTGANKTVQVNYSQKTQQTAFGCTITEIGPGTAYVPTSVSLPDGSSYTITYETTPGDAHTPHYITGRIASITYPTGATTSYTYTGGNNGVDCARKFVPVLTKTTPSGVKTFTHTYGSPQSTVTVVDEAGNEADYGVTDGYYAIGLLNSAKFYTGNGGSKTLLSTTNFSYIGGWNAYLQQEDADTTPAGKSNFSRVEKKWDANGNLTETSLYDYGLVLVRKTSIRYGSYDLGVSCNPIDTGNTIRNRVCWSITTDASGAQVAAEYNQYDSKGHKTVSQQLITGFNYVFEHYTYNATTGALETSQAPNGTTTTITNGACNGLLPTSTSVAGLSTSQTWDCTGGVVKDRTDINGQKTTFAYNDPFWRPTSATDSLGAITTTTYTPNSRETKLNFNGAISTSDNLTTLDSSGRPIVNQGRTSQGGTSFDTVSQTYDGAGRPYTTSVPCTTTAGSTCPTVASTQNYDGLSRPRVKTNNVTLGTITNVYTANDVLSTIPAGTGGTENVKSKQVEFDGLGRMTSVCEITNVAGSAPCGQTVAATGFKTSYVYDALGRVTSVTQGAQTRSFSYDGLNRKTSETNPELGTNGANGTVTYTYDSATGCAGSSAGALIKTVDAVGNVTCRQYDALQRVTNVTYSGPYSANTPAKTFVYDSATVNGHSMAFAAGRLAEAYTGARTTDLGFSYDQRGQIATLYESTPHSGGFYTVDQTVWENGALKTVSGIGLPTLTYNIDGEGRTSTVSASTGINPVLATAYNAASQVTSVTFGSNDLASFNYVNVGQAMSNYQETINGTAMFGNLTWNTNGTLKQLAITDPFNALDAQTCTYVYDDMARASSVSCGTKWAQTFTYDRYGNITKSGSLAWQPGYNAANNHYTLAGVTYDLNGNLTYDTFHNYTWDAAGHMISADAVGLTYDALGRLVEENNSGVYTEYVYALGKKIALMTGQTLSKAYIPLPGGTQVKYTSSGISTYRVPDWLGSLRIGSNPNRTFAWGLAFAPFGERYASSGTPAWTFTGQTEDTASGLYDFLYRELHNGQGRWISPDPAGSGAATNGDPQSWNRYTYARNNPLSFTDPLGLTTDFPPLTFFADQIGFDIGVSVTGTENFAGLSSSGVGGGLGSSLGSGDFGFGSMDFGMGKSKGSAENVNIGLVSTREGASLRIERSSSTDRTRSNGRNVPEVYPPMAQQLFQGNRQVWENANQITDPRTIALWYVVAATPGVAANWSPLSAAGANLWITAETTLPGTTAAVIDLLHMIPDPPNVPSTKLGEAWGAYEFYNWIRGED